jgi:hypothetical protein
MVSGSQTFLGDKHGGGGAQNFKQGTFKIIVSSEDAINTKQKHSKLRQLHYSIAATRITYSHTSAYLARRGVPLARLSPIKASSLSFSLK